MPGLLEEQDPSVTALRIAAFTSGRFRAKVYPLIVVLAVLFGLAAVGLSVQHIVIQRRLLQDAKTEARRKTAEQAGIISANLEKLTPIAQRIAAELSSGALKLEDAPAQFKRALEENPDLFEAGLAYQPYAHDPKVRLFAPHAARTNSGIEQFQIEDRYDYTTRSWFQDGIAAGGPHWGEPYLGRPTNTLVVGYSVPFYRKDDPSKKPIGLVRTNLSLDRIHQLVSSMGLGETGHAFLLSHKGVFLSHANEDYVREQRTIFDVAREHNDESGKRQGERAINGQPGEEDGVSWLTGQSMWMW